MPSWCAFVPQLAARSVGPNEDEEPEVRSAEYLQAFAEPVPKPRTRRFSSSERIPAGHAGGVRAMGNATVIAELIAQGRGGPGPAGAGVPAGAGQCGLRWRGRAAVACLRAATPPVSWRPGADRFRRRSRAGGGGLPGPGPASTPTTAPTIAAPTAIRVICQPVMSPVTPLKVWAAGPNRTTSAGGPGGGYGRVAAKAAGAAATAAARAAASPVSVQASTADGADGIHDDLRWRVVCDRSGGVALAIAGGSPAANDSGQSWCRCWVCGRRRVQRGRSPVIQGAWTSTVRRVA